MSLTGLHLLAFLLQMINVCFIWPVEFKIQ